ncbi:hypothetical protein [Macrococcus equipercicus]|uniref:Uncharacterized protein n=1 Tax=Macrococcus equipercicus TaxID=69967 RepID=A0A9Q9BUH1_9STAP|nr:hypothetical protein [Macrococcus equipercicus]KAA1039100.1 hypothetical protein ERX35_007750 [Macrococcus equipercicus]UTH13277.1 hypothetical protein KFV11_08380 [Macrococcus equipercicus]
MANIDKLVQYAELKAGQFGSDYRENYEDDKVAEIKPNSVRAEGTQVIISYDAHSYTVDLNRSGVAGEVTPEDAEEVAARVQEYFKYV